MTHSQAIKLSQEDMDAWFTHVEHYMEHLIVPFGEDQLTTNYHPTPKTAVDYSISMNVIRLCPLLTTIVEDYIYWNLRPEEPE